MVGVHISRDVDAGVCRITRHDFSQRHKAAKEAACHERMIFSEGFHRHLGATLLLQKPIMQKVEGLGMRGHFPQMILGADEPTYEYPKRPGDTGSQNAN